MSTVQPIHDRAMVAVLDSRVTDLSLPVGTRPEFFNIIGRKRPNNERMQPAKSGHSLKCQLDEQTSAMEKFGERSVFQIECIHDPMPNASGHIFGRMCLRFDGNVLGDINESACMLNVTAGHLEDVLCEIDALDVPELFALTDSELWERLDRALYRDDARTSAEIAADSRKYSKFNFLTNGGESFDRSKSFIVASDRNVRILFTSDEKNCSLVGTTINLYVFVEALQLFLKWIEAEGACMKAEVQ